MFSRSMIFLLVFFALILLAALAFSLGNVFNGGNNEKAVVTVGTAKFVVEVADTATARAQGLSGRKSLEESRGMWFIFPRTLMPRFWMKGMQFPIDIIWIVDGEIVGVEEQVPLPQGMMDLKTYAPPVPIDRVLEVNAGVVAREDIQVGDEVRFEWAEK